MIPLMKKYPIAQLATKWARRHRRGHHRRAHFFNLSRRSPYAQRGGAMNEQDIDQVMNGLRADDD